MVLMFRLCGNRWCVQRGAFQLLGFTGGKLLIGVDNNKIEKQFRLPFGGCAKDAPKAVCFSPK